MTRKVRKIYATACFVLAGAGAAVLMFLTPFGPAGNTRDATGGQGRADSKNAAAFTIDGDAVTPVSPGVVAPLNLRVTNARLVPLKLLELTVTLQGVVAPHADVAHPCTVADFTVQQLAGPLDARLPARSTRNLSSLGVPSAGWPQVGMVDRPANQDGCKGSTVTLAYAATAEVARQ